MRKKCAPHIQEKVSSPATFSWISQLVVQRLSQCAPQIQEKVAGVLTEKVAPATVAGLLTEKVALDNIHNAYNVRVQEKWVEYRHRDAQADCLAKS